MGCIFSSGCILASFTFLSYYFELKAYWVFFCSLPKLRSVTGGCYSPEVFAGKFTVQTSEVSSCRLNFLNRGMAGVVLERREKCMKLYLCAFWGFWVGGGGEGGRRRGLTVL